MKLWSSYFKECNKKLKTIWNGMKYQISLHEEEGLINVNKENLNLHSMNQNQLYKLTVMLIYQNQIFQKIKIEEALISKQKKNKNQKILNKSKNKKNNKKINKQNKM